MFKKFMPVLGCAATLLLLAASFAPSYAAPGHGARSSTGGAHAGRSSGASPRSFSTPRTYSAPRASRGTPRVSGRVYSGPRVSGRSVGRHYSGRRLRGGPFTYGAYAAPFAGYYAYSNYSCDWLLRRARETDSDYWWNRYEACVGDDD